MFQYSEKHLETVTKALALVAVVVYVCGYLIISIRNSSFGFVDNSLFKPKIVEAGTTFLLLLSISVYAAHKQLPNDSLGSLTAWGKLGLALTAYWSEIVTVSVIQGVLFRDDPVAPTSSSTHTSSLLLIVLALLLATSTFIFFNVPRLLGRHPGWVAIISLSAFSGLLIDFSLHSSESNSALKLWLLCSGLIGAWLYRLLIRKAFNLGLLIFAVWFLLLSLSYYANMIYPHIFQRWGGGVPVPIGISTFDKSSEKPTPLLEARLIDQEDLGIFVQYAASDVAIFIPKESVFRLCYLERAQPHSVFDVLAPSNLPTSQKKSGLDGCQPQAYKP